MSTYTEAPASATASGRPDRPRAQPNLSAMLLAAGHGTRLAPLTDLVPKPLCPVGNTPMIDMALHHASGQTDHTVVNVQRFRDKFERWCPSGIDLSIDTGRFLELSRLVGQASCRPFRWGSGSEANPQS